MVKVHKKTTKFIQNNEIDRYNTVADSLSLDEKARIAEELGNPELAGLFEGWKPRPSKRKRSAPLDQRVSITVTPAEKIILSDEIKTLKKSGEPITGSQFIRNRATGSVDIIEWKEIALKALKDLKVIEEQEKPLKNRKGRLVIMIDETDDDEDLVMYRRELEKINEKLGMLIAHNSGRNNRLTGRMSMAEAELVKWRAQRLCISASDYLRMQIFAMKPNSAADRHMSIDARKRFYISIIDVANNGWGQPPNLYECNQCAHYLEQIDALKQQIERLR